MEDMLTLERDWQVAREAIAAAPEGSRQRADAVLIWQEAARRIFAAWIERGRQIPHGY